MDIVPDLSVCVVVRHGRETLFEHLRALQACADPLALQIIAVVAGGGPLAGEVSGAFPEILVYEEAEWSPPAMACNRALEFGAGRYLALVADSLICRPDCLRRLVAFMDEEPEVGVVGPRLLDADGAVLPSAQAFPSLLSLLLLEGPLAGLLPAGYWRRRYRYDDWDRSSSREVGWLSGDCLLFRREVLDEIGPLDEAFGSGRGAVLDYCWRARRAGWHISFRHDAEAIRTGPAAAGTAEARLADSCRYLGRRWLGLLR